MIDLSQLSQQQQEGLAFVTMLQNRLIEEENAQIEQANANLPEGEEPKPLKDLLTTEAYMVNVIHNACDSYYRQLSDEKWRIVRQEVEKKPLDVQQQIAEDLQIPNVLPS
jgi:hypothetical protein